MIVMFNCFRRSGNVDYRVCGKGRVDRGFLCIVVIVVVGAEMVIFLIDFSYFLSCCAKLRWMAPHNIVLFFCLACEEDMRRDAMLLIFK
jgi:hypothetical protein